MDAPLICFDGTIGAGKTTLASLLSKHTRYDLILERFDENDYLADFYSDPMRWALPMQLWFLSERHRQFAGVTVRREVPMVADYSPLKNGVFAALLLDERDLRLFRSLSASLASAVRLPTTLVYLDARDEVLLDRIAKRGRPYEAHIDASYLQSVRHAYEQQLPTEGGVRVARFDTSELDLASPSQMSDFYHRVLTATRG